MKYIVISGGVVSGLGKGITASSIGVLLKGFGIKVTCIKIDPYLNCDAGTMSPFEHGEVYVLDDGGEVDLDIGNYERFLDLSLSKDHNITTGKVYTNVLQKERQGYYLGKTVQVIPHITNEIIDWIQRVSHMPLSFDEKEGIDVADVCLIELGGSVGDIESGAFVEALRQLEYKVGSNNFTCVHVSLVPSIIAGGEPKTKPTQHSVNCLRSLGLNPSIVACRCVNELSIDVRTKIAQNTSLKLERIVSIPNAKGGNVWNVPLTLEEQQVHVMLCESLGLVPQCQFNIEKWRLNIAGKWDALINMNDPSKEINIGIIGKYTENTDAYLSVIKGLQHACIQEGLQLHIKWIDSSLLETIFDNSPFEKLNGILIPGGFGHRGVEGMIKACTYARSNKIPLLGICLGMQVAVIEYCRNVIGITNANSEEFSGDKNDAIVCMPEHNNGTFGGTMRLGLCGTTLNPFSIAYELYQENIVYERHRHRYIVHPLLVAHLQNSGMVISGKDEVTKSRVEIIELSASQHPFYVACQFHPEYKTRPLKPSPLFLGFVKASLQQK